MSIRTDLALESAQAIKTTKPVEGITQHQQEQAGCIITNIVVETPEGAKKIGKPMGQYITIETKNNSGLDVYPDDLEKQVDMLAEQIKALCPKEGEALVIGLGNNDITPDALGPFVAKQIFATRHFKTELAEFEEFRNMRSVSALAPGVLGQTGIEVAEVTKAICTKVKPSVVIVIDALACAEISRLGTTIQITDTGISPGSGVKNARKELSQKTLKAPVIAIGVPTVVDMNTIAETISGKPSENKQYKAIMVTPKNIDKLIDRCAKLISLAINKVFQPDMTIEDITSMI